MKLKETVLTGWWNYRAGSKRVTHVSFATGTTWYMVYYGTIGIDSTRTGAWISAFKIDTSLICTTFGMYRTFWPAIWWLAYVI